MQTILLIGLAVFIAFFSVILIRTWYLQRQFNNSLTLNHKKNKNVLLKQTGGLIVSVAFFVVLYSNPSLLNPPKNDAVAISTREHDVLEAYKSFYGETKNNNMDDQSTHLTVLGEVTLEDKKTYTLVKVDEIYYLINEHDNSLVEITAIP